MKNKTFTKKEIIFYVVIPIFTALLGIVGTSIAQDKREDALVKSMASRYEQIEKNMDLEQALELIFAEKKELEQNTNDIAEENKKLRTKFEKMVDANFFNPSLIIDGLKKENEIKKGIVELDEKIYLSTDLCFKIWDIQPSFDKTNNVVYFGRKDYPMIENKIDLINTDIIYDGKYHKIYRPSDGETFSMGSDTFNKGFTIGADNYSLFGEGNGYALFDLKGQYSKLSITTARVNREDLDIEDATLKVYLNGEYKTEYQLSGQKPSTKLTIDLNYASELKLELCGSKIVYGFTDCILEK